MMFAQRQNHLMVHFSEHIPVVKRCITVSMVLDVPNAKTCSGLHGRRALQKGVVGTSHGRHWYLRYGATVMGKGEILSLVTSSS